MDSTTQADLPSLGEKPRDMFSALGLTSVTSVIVIVPSILTNKIIALNAGIDGVAIVGLYRTLASLLTLILPFGFGLIILRNMAAAKSRREITSQIGASAILFALQSFFMLGVALFGARAIGFWLFQTEASSSMTLEIRIVLLMALGNHALQTVMVLLQGRANLRALVWIQIAVSVSSLALIVPLLRLGRAGLAVNVGSGCIAGVALGLYFIFTIYRPSFDVQVMRDSWKTIRGSALPSLMLVVHGLLMTGCLLLIQGLLSRSYGLHALGSYNAAFLILETLVMLLMSSVRSHFLPALGRCASADEKESLFSRMVSVLLVLAVTAGTLLIFAARFIVPILFSPEFVPSVWILQMLSLSLIGHVLIWSYNTYLLQESDTACFVCIDIIWAAILVGSAILCSRRGYPFEFVVYGYILSGAVSGLLYVLVSTHRHGKGLLRPANAAFGVFGLAWLSLSYAVSQRISAAQSAALLCACAVLITAVFVKAPIRIWLKENS